MTEVVLTVRHPAGLHARPASAFVQKAREFKSRVTIQNLSRPNSAAVTVSAFNLLQIGVKSGHEICVRAEGEDEASAIAALKELVESNFGE